MNLEDHIRKYYRQQSDKQIAVLFCTTVSRVERVRQNMRLFRESSIANDRPTPTKAERDAWYQGIFDPHETHWAFSGLTRS
jgi:hypothetical protein